jgi:hypothetical protein
MSQTRHDAESPRRPLDFERGNQREGRIGDPRPARERKEEFPARRVREAGTTGGETADHHDTADDMTPETLLDAEASHTPGSTQGRGANDTATRTVGAADIGGGDGLDEAEMAERRPVGAGEARRIQRKAREHAADPNMVEPHETQERVDAARRQRNARH